MRESAMVPEPDFGSYYGKQISLCGGKGKRRDYGYYRCVGTDAYRFGGHRVCSNKQVRQDLPIIYLWTFKNIVAMKRNITGFTLVPDGLIRFTGVKY